MRVYELGADLQHYRRIDVPEYRGFWRWHRRFNGNSLKRYWTGKQKFRFFPPNWPKGDMPHMAGAIPVFTLKAVRALSDFLEPNGELIKIRCQKDTLFLYNATRIVDALDEENSLLVRFRDGSMFPLDPYVFYEDRLTGMTIFKLPQWRLGPPYVTDPFVQRVIERGLKGFWFRLVWSTEEVLDPYSASPFIITT
jgi:hypothetical protein